MTLKEEAYAIIERLPDKVMEDVLKALKKTEANPRTWETPEQEQAREAKELEERREALKWLQDMRMKIQDMRKENPELVPDDYEEAYADALAEKYGVAK